MSKREVPKLQVSYGQNSVQGSKEFNEDSYACVTPSSLSTLDYKGIAATICDGSGDNGDGLEASQYCIQQIYSEYFNSPESWGVKKSGIEVLKEINRWMVSHSGKSSGGRMMTTLTMAIFCHRRLNLFHLGDSRLYLIRDGKMQLLTTDHHHPEGNQDLLLRAMGMDSRLYADYESYPLEEGDLYLMVTDGVYKWVEDNDMNRLVNASQNLNEVCSKINQLAIENGGDDNASTQLIKVVELPLATRSELIEEIDDLVFPPFFSKGDILDEYRIIDDLDHKALSSVYLAEEIKTGIKVAIKCPNSEHEGDPYYLERFLREEWVGKRFHCPQLMKIQTVKGMRSKYLYFVMEYCRGENLQQRVDNNRLLSSNECVEMTKQLCHGLNFMHNLDIIHRDIKPDNLVYSPEGILKLIDYGIVRISGLNALHTHEELAGLAGSPNFMAPELFKDSYGSPQTDIFSMGVTLYYLLSGTFPYGEVYQLEDYKDKEYCSLIQNGCDVPQWLEAMLEKMVQLDVNSRFQAISEILYAVEHPGEIGFRKKSKPLIERNPTKFWKMTCLYLLILNLVTFFYFLAR